MAALEAVGASSARLAIDNVVVISALIDISATLYIVEVVQIYVADIDERGGADFNHHY